MLRQLICSLYLFSAWSHHFEKGCKGTDLSCSFERYDQVGHVEKHSIGRRLEIISVSNSVYQSDALPTDPQGQESGWCKNNNLSLPELSILRNARVNNYNIACNPTTETSYVEIVATAHWMWSHVCEAVWSLSKIGIVRLLVQFQDNILLCVKVAITRRLIIFCADSVNSFYELAWLNTLHKFKKVNTVKVIAYEIWRWLHCKKLRRCFLISIKFNFNLKLSVEICVDISLCLNNSGWEYYLG